MEQHIPRYKPNIKIGLTDEQIKRRNEDKLVNYDTSVPTKSIKRILYENFFTLFNFLNLFLGIAIFCVGSYKNMLFLGIVILNTAISTIQEIHSKKVVDKLSVVSAAKAIVIRNGKKEKISINEIVLDDLLELNTGNQIVTDCKIIDGNIEVNESFITGEPDSITKQKGDDILSGSYVVSGKCIAQVEHVGEENYTSQISSGAKYIKKVNSEIMTSLQKIIKILTFAIIPVGILLFINQIKLPDITYQEAVVKTVAGIIGMIPEGLVLLTSTVLAVSVIRLSKSKVLVQELYCIETLARVDTLCLDKTGTLTEGKMEVKDYISFENNKKSMENILANIAINSEDDNPTINAIKDKFIHIKNKFELCNKVAFSSKSKWSGIEFKENGTYVIGAPEFILKKDFEQYADTIKEYANDYRVILLAYSKNSFENKKLPQDIKPIGIILISDKIRKEATETLKYFEKQGVDIKIISGDNPITVSKIAKQVGVKNYKKYVDMSQIPEGKNLNDIVQKYTIFGRVSPTQKKQLVLSLQEQGKTVAMTGDGVNDVLALKAADCSIAMANGSDATKNVSQLVLLDSNFASMPKVVNEGRQTINNIQRSATLFLVKTIYSTVLALMFLFMGEEYPFVPIQLSLISEITIGLPSFILALEPNKERIKGKFLKNVIEKALPTALTAIVNVFSIIMLYKFNLVSEQYYSSLCVIALGACGITLLFTLSKSRKSEETKLPVSVFRFVLSFAMLLLFIIGLTGFNWWFNICQLEPIKYEIIRLVFVTIVNYIIISFVCSKVINKKIKNGGI